MGVYLRSLPMRQEHHMAWSPDPLGAPITYIESWGAFKAIKTSKYGWCHFYQVGVTGDFPTFPEPWTPATSDDIYHLLKKAHKQAWPNLVVALSQDTVTVIALQLPLHNHVSLQWLKMEMDKEAGDQPSWKLCPFCQYTGSNDQSYLNHIMCAHYCANYGCGKCLDTVFTSGQKLSKHMKKCKVLPKDGAKEEPSPSHVKGMSASD